MPLSRFDVQLEAGDLKAYVDGEDVSAKVQAVQLTQDTPDAIPKLVLVTDAAGAISGKGVVEVRVLDDRLLQALDRINPQELEEAALARLEWGSPGGLIHQALEILKERLNGDQPEGRPGSG